MLHGSDDMNIDNVILNLGNVGLLLESVETKGEGNLNNLLAAIQLTRKTIKELKEIVNDENHDKQGESV
jgi:hypothetical protein